MRLTVPVVAVTMPIIAMFLRFPSVFARCVERALCICIVVCTCSLAEGAESESSHWCFQPLADVEPPVGSHWNKTAVDGFIEAKLNENDLRPQGEADRHTLIRRLTAGLTGLPPTLNEIKTFVDDARGSDRDRDARGGQERDGGQGSHGGSLGPASSV